MVFNLFQRGLQEEDWAIVTNLPFSIVDANLTDVDLDIKAGLGWGSIPRITLAVELDTGDVRKVGLMSLWSKNPAAFLEVSIKFSILRQSFTDSFAQYSA